MADARLKKKIGVGRHLSAMKRHRQSLKRKTRNRVILSATKTLIKKVRTAVSEKNKDGAATGLKSAIAGLSKAATKGVLPKARASRLSSRLSKAVNSIG